MYAIIRSGGKQYRVREGDRINVDQIDLPAGSDVILDEVLSIEEDAHTKVGTPLVNGASVSATIEAHIRDKKVTYFHYKSKTRQKRMRGHRQHLTSLQINTITTG